MSEKRCSRCKETKPADAFQLNKSRKDGLQDYCRACRTEVGRPSSSNIRNNLRRYERISGKPTVISTEEVMAIRDAATTCAYCGDNLEAKPREIEHIYAAKAYLSAGSSHINLTVACKPCNSAKGNRHPYAFYLRSERFTDALFAKFAKDYGSRMLGRNLTDAEAQAFVVGFRDEYYALQASKAEVAGRE